MAYAYRGRRVAYDNVAVGSVAGYENHIAVRQTSGNTSDDVSNGVSEVSAFGDAMAGGGFTNIANAALPGVEDTDNASADKLTSDGETVAD
jgi:hypothetical protein